MRDFEKKFVKSEKVWYTEIKEVKKTGHNEG